MKNEIYRYLRNHPPALEMFKKLENAGNIYLIGGVLREFLDHRRIMNLRDIDIIIDVKNDLLWKNILNQYMKRRNRFGGYKLESCGLVIDIWAIEDTWAYRSGTIQCNPQDYFSLLPETVFLNLDSIVYDWDKSVWLNKRYEDAMRTKVLDVVLANNPQLQLNIMRALVLKNRYKMTFSNELKCIICDEAKNFTTESLFCQKLFDEQMHRYNEEILSREEIQNEIVGICSV